MTKTYKSKIGPELLLPIGLVLGFESVIIAISGTWVALSILIVLILFISNIFLKTFYRITNEVLEIKCGFLYSSRINIKDIIRITETNNPLSSPATSLDRIEIRYNKYDSVLISPKDKLGFVDDILAINPNVDFVPKSRTNKSKSRPQ